MSQSRYAHQAIIFGFEVEKRPFIYLGVFIFKGRPKVRHFQLLDDKVRLKSSFWKVYLLSATGRLKLLKPVVQGMLLHFLNVYN